MKLSWKIFRNTILLVLFALSLGGTIMISMTFHESLSSKIVQEKEEMQSMQRDIAVMMAKDSRTLYQEEGRVLEAVIQTLEAEWKEEGKLFRIRNKAGKILSYNGDIPLLTLENQNEGRLKYTIFNRQGLYYLQMTVLMNFEKETIRIDKFTDLTSIFALRKVQQKFFLQIMLSVGILCALLNFLNVLWISRALVQFKDTVLRMGQGDLKARMDRKTDDEIGLLAENFNKMADRLEENIFELKEETKKQEEFAGSFAHEIRTPLTSIIGYADLLRRKQLEGEAYFTATNYIFSEGKRLENLASKLLDLFSVKGVIQDYTVVPVRRLLEESLHIMQGLLEEKEIILSIEIEDFNVRVDEALMKTVIVNLLDNARKAVETGGRIAVEARREGKQAVIAVSDNGRGIPVEEIPKIQEAFYRVDKSRSRKEGGAGLGLSICANIMKLHEGEIGFGSELNKGTRVTLRWEGIVNEE